MKAKVFVPKTAGMTKKEIWNFFYTKEGKTWVCEPTGEEIVKPAFTAKEIPDRLCQRFVDLEQYIREELVDEPEEEFVEERGLMVDDLHQLILRALKRKELTL